MHCYKRPQSQTNITVQQNVSNQRYFVNKSSNAGAEYLRYKQRLSSGVSPFYGSFIQPPLDSERVPYVLFKEEIFGDCDADTEIIDPQKIVPHFTIVGRLLAWSMPKLSLTTLCICIFLLMLTSPRSLSKYIIFPVFRLSFGTLYPAYASYKAVRTKNVKEYVKWMMYWIVYAFFTCFETFTDIFLSWFPFYYEVKVVIVLWLLSPATKGSSTLYRKFVHPTLTRREQEIDEYLNQAKERGYTAVLQLGSKGVNYATNVIMQTAIKGGGNLVQTIRRSYSLSDLSEPDLHRTTNEVDEVMVTMQSPKRVLRNRLPTSTVRSTSGTRHSTGMYYNDPEDMTAKVIHDLYNNVRSTNYVSSGYSSTDTISPGISRTASMTNASKHRPKRSEQLLFQSDKPSTSLMEFDHEQLSLIPFSLPREHIKQQLYGIEVKEIPHALELSVLHNNFMRQFDGNSSVEEDDYGESSTDEFYESNSTLVDNHENHKEKYNAISPVECVFSDYDNKCRPYKRKKSKAPDPPNNMIISNSDPSTDFMKSESIETEI